MLKFTVVTDNYKDKYRILKKPKYLYSDENNYKLSFVMST